MPQALPAIDEKSAKILNLGSGQNAESRTKALADSLINTPFFPPGFAIIRQIAREAEAYHNLRPYPWWQFTDWKLEERGPLPRCIPLPRRIVKKGAKWLFGKPVQINVPANTKLEEFLRTAWQQNRMPTRMVAAAEQAGYQGGIALKFAYDKTAKPRLSFQVLSVIDSCRLFYDPHDSDKLLMARVQYPVFNPQDGQTYIYREEWTDDWEVHYEPALSGRTGMWRRDGIGQNILIGDMPVINGTSTEPDRYEKWKETTRTRNVFGVIPVVPIKNADVGNSYGFGDLWTDAAGGMFRVIDRINLSFHLMDKSNQFDGERNIVFIDANAGADVVDRPLAPGQPLSIKTDLNAGDGKQAQVVELEAAGAMREHMLSYAVELRNEILLTVGSVDARQDEITNKGAMTEAVMTQIYAPLIETTEEKRKTYGEDGIAKFLELCAVGLRNAEIAEDGIKSVNIDNDETFDVQLNWSKHFQKTETEKGEAVKRIDSEVVSGYITRERAVEMVAVLEEVEDIGKLKEELKEVHAQLEEQDRAAADMAVAAAEKTARDANEPYPPASMPMKGMAK